MTKNIRWLVVFALIVTVPSRGRAGDGTVALQSADPSCADDSGNTYVYCGNGTVTDNRTGLVWLQDANCYGMLDWHQAEEIVANLSDIPATSEAAGHDCGLSDGSSPGEWRLPSLAEWEAMIADAVALGCDPTITDDQGDGCWASTLECFLQGRNCSFTGVDDGAYWSSTTCVTDTADAWLKGLNSGNAACIGKFVTTQMWPVRGGQ